jgi:hypothetical protein
MMSSANPILNVLTKNYVHLWMTVAAGIIVLLPLFLGVDSYVEDSQYAATMKSPMYRGINFFLLGILVPLIMDTLLDVYQLIVKRLQSKSDKSNPSRNPTKLSFVGSIMNTYEIIVFAAGVAVVPLTTLMLPDTNKKATLIVLCCWKVSTALIGGSYMSSLTRFFSGTKHIIMSFLTVVCIILLALGGVISLLALNYTGSAVNVPLFSAGIALNYSMAVLAVVCNIYWLTSVAYADHLRSIYNRICGAFIMQSSSVLEEPQPPSPAVSAPLQRDGGGVVFVKYQVTFFRTVHVLTSMLFIIMFGAAQALFKVLKNATELQAILYLMPMLVWGLSTLLRIMRQVQLAALENMVSLYIRLYYEIIRNIT